MFNKILGKYAMWLNNFSLFSNKLKEKNYNKLVNAIKQLTPPPEIKNYDF